MGGEFRGWQQDREKEKDRKIEGVKSERASGRSTEANAVTLLPPSFCFSSTSAVTATTPAAAAAAAHPPWQFWETVGRVFGRPGFNTQLMHIGLCRVKNHMRYPECEPGGADLKDGVLFAKVRACVCGESAGGGTLAWPRTLLCAHVPVRSSCSRVRPVATALLQRLSLVVRPCSAPRFGPRPQTSFLPPCDTTCALPVASVFLAAATAAATAYCAASRA